MSDAERIKYLEECHLRNIRARDEVREEAAKAVAAKDEAEKRLADLRYQLAVPEGATRLDAWEYKGELIVCGIPDDGNGDVDDLHQHNCDAMGCSSVGHVIIRMSMEAAKTVYSAHGL